MIKKTDAEREKSGAVRMTVAGSLITLVKLAAAASTASVFAVVSAFYSCTALAAKILCARGRKAENADKKTAVMATVAALLVASAVFYTAGAVRSFFTATSSSYGKIPSIAIAAIALTQAAILSFADGADNSVANAIIGLIAGCSMTASAVTSAIVAIKLFAAGKKKNAKDAENENV